MSIDADTRDGDLNVGLLTHLERYMESLSQEGAFETYKLGTVVEDLVYGIGISIDHEKYSTAVGYALFKADLIELLTGTKNIK